MDYRGVVIEESLRDASLLDLVHIIKTEEGYLEEEVNKGVLHFHKVEVGEVNIQEVIERGEQALKEGWYMHFVGEESMYVVFPGKTFLVHKGDWPELEAAKEYGKSSGIIEDQMDFGRLIENPWDE